MKIYLYNCQKELIACDKLFYFSPVNLDGYRKSFVLQGVRYRTILEKGNGYIEFQGTFGRFCLFIDLYYWQNIYAVFNIVIFGYSFDIFRSICSRNSNHAVKGYGKWTVVVGDACLFLRMYSSCFLWLDILERERVCLSVAWHHFACCGIVLNSV